MRGCPPIAAMLCLLATAVWGQGGRPGTVQQEMEAARRAGIPVTPREMQGTLPPPDQNAAVYYLRIGDVSKRRTRAARDFALIEAAGLPNAEQGERVRQALLRNPDVRDLVHAALRCERCVFPVSPAQSAAAEARQYVPVHTAARWIRAESFDLWARGDRSAAVNRLRDGFTVARHVASNRTQASFLVACTLDALILDAMDQMLLSRTVDTAAVDAIASAVRTAYRDPSPSDSLVGDAVQQLLWAARLKRERAKAFPQLIRNVAMAAPASLKTGWKPPHDWNGFLNSAVAYALWMTRREMAAVRLPYPQAVRAIDALAADVNACLRRRDPVVLLAAATWSASRLPAQSLARAQARRATTQALAAVVAWKLRHGGWPPTLSNAMPPPADPFDLKPLRYARQSSGFAIWSVGPSGRFDGSRMRGAAPIGEVGVRWPRSRR